MPRHTFGCYLQGYVIRPSHRYKDQKGALIITQESGEGSSQVSSIQCANLPSLYQDARQLPVGPTAITLGKMVSGARGVALQGTCQPFKSDHQQLSSGKCATNLKWNHRNKCAVFPTPNSCLLLGACGTAEKQNSPPISCWTKQPLARMS